MGDETRKAIGLFWDIENCQVPRAVSALAVVQRLRERFFVGLREAEFMCVCDINKEQKSIVEELNNGQVNVVHISATAKNAADDKIKQSLRRFADTHPPETKIILISGDVNFSSELSDLRHRKHMYIVLIHGKQVHEALVQCAHENYVYDELMADLPRRIMPKDSVYQDKLPKGLKLIVRGFPGWISRDLIRKRLVALSSNCGGRVVHINDDKATLAFPTPEAAQRAKRRMADEDVYGLPITLTTCRDDEAISAALSPTKFNKRSNSGIRERSDSGDRQQLTDAPGAPGYVSPIKKFGSQQSAFSSGYSSSQNSYTTVAQKIYISQTQNNYTPDQDSYITASTYHDGDTYSSSADTASDFSSQPSAHSIALLQRAAASFPDQLDLQGESQQQLQTKQIHGPNLAEPPPSFANFPMNAVEAGIPGTLNISKTYNVTYQQSYTPRMYHPQPVYPYQQNNSRSSVYNPGPRQSAKFCYDFNRPRSRNSGSVGSFNSQQARPYNSRGLPSSSDMFDDDDEDGLEMAYFRAHQQADGEKQSPVDLTVTNLDYNISKKEWRKILAATFQPHVKVLGICVRTQPDNTSIASIKVPSVEDARFAISQFHRRKIGYKRINVALNDDRDQAPAESTRQETISILSDAKAFTMPVFKFIENYEKRYHKSVSVSDLYKMKDVVEIMDRGGAGRMVKLARGVCPTPSPTPEDLNDPFQEESLDQPVCLIHCPEGSHQYADAMSMGMLPNVKLQRKPFAAQVHSLLLSHNGVMPLMSFPMCYKSQFGSIPPSVEEGVYMEHLISCVPGVEIVVSKKGVKVIHFQEKKDPPGAEAICGRTSPMLSQQMALLSREIGDLLRQSRLCSIPASKFIPAYHHHFGRQCRVADYGYTKLAELFEALPHVLQVLGTGDRKVLTLSHRAQVKRFIADVLKVLKTQPGKQLCVSDLPVTYERVLFRKFDISHYGVAFIEDMFMDIPPTSILITIEGNKTILAIPKRDQTPEEIKRTEQFALELIDLLKHNPHGRMTFNKFIPAYHHHFGRQCRVADYGFTRLTDLFESVSQVVETVDDEEERMIKLTAPEMRVVLAEQITGLLRESPGMVLPLDQVLLTFQRQYSFPLRLSDFGVCNVKDLLGKIKHCVYVDSREDPPIVKLRPTEDMPPLFALRVVQLLMDQSGGCLPLVELCSRYRSTFGMDCDVQEIQDMLLEYVMVSSESDDGSAVIRLTALQILGRDVRTMLRKVGSTPLPTFSQVYQEHYFVELKPALYGFPDISSLLRSMPHIVKVTGRPGRKFVELSPILGSGNEEEEMIQLDRVSSISRIDDPLSAPVPSNVPSPILFPKQNMMPDLMKFDSLNMDYKDMFDLTSEEKRGLRTPLCRTPTSMLQAEFSALSSPDPLHPRQDTFPGDVPLSSPFPPPPSFPVDLPPPNLSMDKPSVNLPGGPHTNAQWPVLPRPPPVPFSRTPQSSSTPNFDKPGFFSASAPPQLPLPNAPPSSQQNVMSAGASELTPASLQWKEWLEGGTVNFTPQQLNNLESMKLLKKGDLAVSDSNPRPTSAPSLEASRNGLKSDPDHVKPRCDDMSAAQSVSVGGHIPNVKTEPSLSATGPAGSEAPMSIADDPSIIHSSMHAPLILNSQPPMFGLAQFGGGTFMEFKIPGASARSYKGLVSSAGFSKAEGVTVSKQLVDSGVRSLEQVLKETLKLSRDTEDVSALEASVVQAGSTSSMDSSHSDIQGSFPAATSEVSLLNGASVISKEASPASASHKASPSESSDLSAMSPAGDASLTMASSALFGEGSASAPALPSKLSAGSGDSGSMASIPPNDSFSLDQPLDTSSTRSAGSGSVSDTMSMSPSPRKNPRRAKLAAKFFNPGLN